MSNTIRVAKIQKKTEFADSAHLLKIYFQLFCYLFFIISNYSIFVIYFVKNSNIII